MFEKKYIKYKNKYSNLKTLYGGTVHDMCNNKISSITYIPSPI